MHIQSRSRLAFGTRRSWGPIGLLIGAVSVMGFSPASAGVSTTVEITDTGIQNTGIDRDIRAYNTAGSTGFLGYQLGDGHGDPFTGPGDSGLYHCDVFSCFTPYTAPATSGSADQTGNLARAFDKLSGSSGDGPAKATAASNLANGTLHASAAGSFGFVYQGEDQYSEGAAVASQSDGLHFNIAGAGAQTQTQISIVFSIDGTETTTRSAQFGYQNGSTLYWLNLGDTSIRDSSMWTPGNAYPTPVYTAPQVFDGNGDVQLLSVDRLSNLPTNTKFIATYQLTGATVDTDFFDVLSTSCGDGVTCDFSHTAKVKFVLPTNVSFTSDSGVFLTQAAVPEPTTWAMMLVGVGGLGAVARRRRQPATAAA